MKRLCFTLLLAISFASAASAQKAGAGKPDAAGPGAEKPTAGSLYSARKLGIYASYAGERLPDAGAVYPSLTIGLSTHLSPAFALRPGVSFYYEDEENDEFGLFASDGYYYLLGGGIDLLCFKHLSGNFSLFLSAGAWYSYTETKDRFADGETSSQYRTHNIFLPLKFGGQYLFTKNFGFYADAGVVARWRYETHKQYTQAPYAITEDTAIAKKLIGLSQPSFGAVIYLN